MFLKFAVGFLLSDARMTSELSSYRVRKKYLRDQPAFRTRIFVSVQAGGCRP
jgi:hypothetical protein